MKCYLQLLNKMEIEWGILVPETLSNVLAILLATHVSFVLFFKRHLVTTGTTNKARYIRLILIPANEKRVSLIPGGGGGGVL